MYNNSKYEDFLYIYLKGYKKEGKSHFILKTFNRPFLVKIWLIIRHFLAFSIASCFHSPKQNITNKLCLYILSNNTYNSLKFLLQAKNTVFLQTSLKLSIPRELPIKHIKNKWIYSYKYFCILSYFLIRHTRFTFNYFDLIYYSVGYYESFITSFTKERPSIVVMSNDHNYDSRALLMACKKLNIKTVYIQHASVSNLFPPLSFDLNLLEGNDSLNKYKLCGEVSGETHLIGMPKFDLYQKMVKPIGREIKNIGIAFNTFDNIEDVRKILLFLSKNTKYNITYRPHPLENRTLEKLDEINNIQKSSNKENSFDFLANQDILISGNSSILLEATLLNIVPMYFPLNKKVDDYYGFVKNNLADNLTNLNDIIMNLNRYKNKVDVRKRACYYNATINTIHDGKSEQQALSLIQTLIEKNQTVDDIVQ